MSYKALYRTYRPQTFEEVAGQQHIVKTLSNALKENKIAHAYLFCGPRGTGKTTMARLFAKALNCEEGFGHQCNECSNCVSISEGSHPDVIEIDAASNRGIDDIRDIISKVKYSPIKGKWKVYIIDEVHMMTPEAFNALLKTLEEPPENGVFILATTEPFKLMPTILSRVQRYDFTKIPDKDLFNNLKKVCNSENIKVEDEALRMIVSLSDGGGRDSLSMLDQAIAYCGDSLELHHVQELFGLSTLEEKMTLINALNNNDVLTITNTFDELANHGVDIKRLTTELIDIVKDLLIYKTTHDYTILKVVTKDIASESSISKTKLIYMLDTLMDCYSQFRFVSNIKSILEVGFLKIASYSETPVQEKVVYVKEESKPVASPTVQPKPIQEIKKPIAKETSVVEELPKKLEDKTVPQKPILSTKGFSKMMDEGTPLILTEDDTINIMVQASKQEKMDLIQAWPKLDQYISDPSIGQYVSVLRSCSPRVVGKGALILETNFKNIARKISYKENQKAYSKIVEDLCGKKYMIFALTNEEALARIQKFANLRQINKLPTPKPIYFDFSYDEKNREKTETEKFAEEFLK